jgi:MOSC domain-containing protein
MELGTVAALYRFPVKAMAAEALDHADVWWFGLPGDRRYAFVQSDHRGDFPWLTIRELPELTRYRPASAADPEKDPPVITTPAGRELEITDPALADELAEKSRRRVHLHRDHRGTFDAFPVSVISLQTVAALGELLGRELDPRRFRQTIVLDAPGGAFAEEALLGRSIAVGDARLRLSVRDVRCMVVNFDPDSAERDPQVLRALARNRDTCLGVYATVEAPGAVRLGDPVQAA